VSEANGTCDLIALSEDRLTGEDGCEDY